MVDLTIRVQVAPFGVGGPFQGVDGVLASCEVGEVPEDPIGFLELLVGVAVVVNAAIVLASLLSIMLENWKKLHFIDLKSITLFST